MSTEFAPFSDESLRIAVNLTQRHDALVAAIKRLEALPNSMFWAAKGDKEYLAIKRHKGDSGTTLGPRSAETEAKYDEFIRDRAAAQSALDATNAALAEVVAQYRALKLPVAMARPAQILRELDIAGLLGTDIMLVGTNAFSVYEIEAGCRFPRGIDETDDFDVAWCRGAGISLSSTTEKATGAPLMRVLRSIDSDYRVNPRKQYQALAFDGYQVELLVAPSRFKTFSADEPFKPMAIFQEQEWLLNGRAVRHVIASRDGKTCPIFAPDPRWMALHKLWLSRKPERDAKKRPKDEIQGNVLLDAVLQRMEVAYPLDTDFLLDLPPELRPLFDEWARSRGFMPEKPRAPAMR